MSWVRIDDGFEDHAKVEPLSDAAHRLWMRAACWCSKPENAHTQGFVPRALLRTISRKMASQKRLEKLAQELVDATGGGVFKVGLWEPVEGGWRIHDWDQYRPREGAPADGDAPKPKLSRAEAARAAGIRSAEARRARNGSAQPRTNAERRSNEPPNVVRPNEPRTAPNVVRTPDPDPDPGSDPSGEAETKDLPGVTRVQPAAPPPRFRMNLEWEPSELTKKSLELAGVPEWAERQLRARFVAHYAESEAVGAPNEWNQRYSRWALRDWQNPNTRPKRDAQAGPEAKSARELADDWDREAAELWNAR